MCVFDRNNSFAMSGHQKEVHKVTYLQNTPMVLIP